MEIRKAAILITITKISNILHFANQSNQRKIDPRREIDTLEGDENHNQRVKISLVYGHIPEKITIRTASSRPPAFQISIVDRAIENSKNFSIVNLSPAISASMLTVAPKLKWPERKNTTFNTMTIGISNRIKHGISELRNIEVVVMLSLSSISSSDFC
mmetsp:Transcript_30322/g.34827  ORF Transcript_30322/g.34827 Transcript_30322/m.34827 type:complete len:158 (-) Transcript_30322:4882-5355(-)